MGLVLLLHDRIDCLVINDIDPAISAPGKAVTADADGFSAPILDTPLRPCRWTPRSRASTSTVRPFPETLAVWSTP